MTSQYHSRINSLEREVANIDRDIAKERKKEADLISRIRRAEDAVNRSKSLSTVQSKQREIERHNQQLAATKKKQADLSKKRSEKSKSLRDYQTRQVRADDTARKKFIAEERRLVRDRQSHERSLSSQSVTFSHVAQPTNGENESFKRYDYFLCHACEDKEDFVRPLAEAIRSKGAVVWYDEFTVVWGDKLRRKIDEGLVNSRFGVVVLSEHFFNKEWPQRELDGLVALETASPSEKRILPIWHKISKDEVARYSPTLADTIALNTSLLSIEEIADRMMGIIQEEHTTEPSEPHTQGMPLGKWLVENTPRGTNLEIPSRRETGRKIPFIDEADE